MSFISITTAKTKAERVKGARASIYKAKGRDNLIVSAALPSGGRMSREIAANAHGFVNDTAVAGALRDLLGAAAARQYVGSAAT